MLAENLPFFNNERPRINLGLLFIFFHLYHNLYKECVHVDNNKRNILYFFGFCSSLKLLLAMLNT